MQDILYKLCVALGQNVHPDKHKKCNIVESVFEHTYITYFIRKEKWIGTRQNHELVADGSSF